MTSIKKTQLGILAAVIVWLAGSIILSTLGLLDQSDTPPTFFGLFLVGVPLVFLFAYVFSKNVKNALLALPLWFIVAIHSLRFVGIFFVIDALTHAFPHNLAGQQESEILSRQLSVFSSQLRFTISNTPAS
jgi:hypothetical protein